MQAITPDRPRARRLPFLSAVFAAILLTAGLSAVVVVSEAAPVAAATVGFSQCNGFDGPDGAALSVSCSIDIVNTLDITGGTSTTVYSRVCTLGNCTGDIVSPSNLINAVHQCNFSDIEGGSTTICSVNIVNNIYVGAPNAPTPLTLEQCIGSGTGGGTLMTACIPSSQASPTVTQCNRSGTGGGGAMTCSATGTSSSAFPVFVDQCNDSETGGGSFVTCTTTITNNIFDTDTGAVPPSGSTPGTGAPDGSPVVDSPVVDSPVVDTPVAETPEAPPFVVVPPGFTG